MRTKPDPRVAGFLDEIAIEGIGLATITVWEILNGIGRLDSGKCRKNLVERFQLFHPGLGAPSGLVLSLDASATRSSKVIQKHNSS